MCGHTRVQAPTHRNSRRPSEALSGHAGREARATHQARASRRPPDRAAQRKGGDPARFLPGAYTGVQVPGAALCGPFVVLASLWKKI